MSPFERWWANQWRNPTTMPKKKKKKKMKPLEEQLAEVKRYAAAADRRITELQHAKPDEVKDLELKVKQQSKIIVGQSRKIQELMDELEKVKNLNG